MYAANIGENGQLYSLQSNDDLFHTHWCVRGQLDPVLRGLFRQPGQQFDRFVTDDVTNHLYRLRNDSYGLDLIAMNIQRGRDHGIRPYVDYVRYCTGRVCNLNLIRNTAADAWDSMYNFKTTQLTLAS